MQDYQCLIGILEDDFSYNLVTIDKLKLEIIYI